MTSKVSKTHEDNEQLVEAVRGSVHQIWQAGLGAFLKAQQEGNAIFQDLVHEVEKVQSRMRDAAGGKLSELTDAVTKMAENASKQATGSWEKLENVFEDRVSRSLRNIGVPTRDDIAALGEQIEELRKSVEAMAGKGKTAKQPVKKAAAPVRKTAAKAKTEKTTVRAKGNGAKTTRRPSASAARSM